MDPIIPGTSEVQALQSENPADINLYKISSSVLLLGTVNSNKELLKRSILQREYHIMKTDDKKSIVDTKDKNVILEVSKKVLRSLPQFSMPDKNKIQLHYTKCDDQVFKLVDGPVYDTNNINKFIEDMKSCLSLSQEGFNAIIVAFTLDRAKDCNSLINMLHSNFGINVNTLISVIIYENELKIGKGVEGDYAQVKSVCGDRLLRYNIENHIQEIKHLISCVSQMEFNWSSQPLCIKNERSLLYSEWEEILKDICLMLEMVLDNSQTLHDESKKCVDLLVMLWRKHQAFAKQEIDTDDDDDQTKKDEFNSNNKHTIKMGNSIIEDVTYVIECFRIIYSVSEPMRRCKEILIPSFKTSYQNFHDWYVMSVIKDKENLLDSNLKMKLFNLMKK
ncbi:uncharacterized protein LOC131939372 [Physella acuta]|uniref:uncharacterized protein LOC131939372 n=1 Tax=Physella acuta TaxID=109671 RepID=UPI0027DC882C|nr:uncharacterized protein LOC131939372 [Physella acuta]